MKVAGRGGGAHWWRKYNMISGIVYAGSVPKCQLLRVRSKTLRFVFRYYEGNQSREQKVVYSGLKPPVIDALTLSAFSRGCFMARERSKPSKKSDTRKSASKEKSQSSKSLAKAKNRQTVPQREPWTPWGRWAKRRRERKEQKRQERAERKRQRQDARRKRWARRRLITTRGAVFIGLGVLACAIAGGVILLLGHPYPWETIAQVRQVLQLNEELESQRQRWESLAIDWYEVEIEYTDDQETWCGPVLVEVRDGEIQDVPSPDDTHWFPPERCAALFDDLMIDPAYDWLKARVTEFQPATRSLMMTFDETFGNPTLAEAGVYDAEDTPPGCCWRVTWQNLRPLYDE